ncbi:MAG: hypothetical protein IT327_12785 [Anaerolineae bacterium]|jgi:DNA-binding transcriptional regulator/RsmH inhibitor MraZ|nr:hypothetical protein [Anaerolineae bacterium]
MSQLTAITFDAVLEDDNITIPANYRDEVVALFKNKKVKVTVEPAENVDDASEQSSTMDEWQKTHTSFIQFLMENPIKIAHPVRLTKEELHER